MGVLAAALRRTAAVVCAKTAKITLEGGFAVMGLAGNAEKIGTKVDFSIDWFTRCSIVSDKFRKT